MIHDFINSELYESSIAKRLKTILLWIIVDVEFEVLHRPLVGHFLDVWFNQSIIDSR